MLSCPFEILSDGSEHAPDSKRLPAIAQALSALGYDAGTLTPDEADALQKADAPRPKHFTVLGPQPQTDILYVADMPIGLVYFPVPPNPKEAIPTDLSAAVAKAAAGLRDRVKLVIGISGWGMTGEEDFLTAHPAAVDILLGSGPTAGLAARSGGNKTLWSRSYGRGKTINRLDIMALPGTSDFSWKPGTTYKAEVISLDDLYPADPDIQKIFHPESS